MLAVAVAPGFPLGRAVPAPGAPGAAAAAPAAPVALTPFTGAIMTAIEDGIDLSGYQLSYRVFIASLQPSLLHHYPPPGAARAAPAAPAAVAPGGDPVAAAAPAQPPNIRAKHRIRALNGGTPGDFPEQLQPDGWSRDEVNRIINAADRSVSDDIKNSVPFIRANYDDAVLAYINNRANQGTKPPTVFRI
jgi:hypothetical protein